MTTLSSKPDSQFDTFVTVAVLCAFLIAGVLAAAYPRSFAHVLGLEGTMGAPKEGK